MDDKRMKDKLNHMPFQELTFTKEDRKKVFEQINKIEKSNSTQKKSKVPFSKQISVITASILVVGLCIVLFMPSLLQGNFYNENNENNASGVVTEKEYSSILVMVKDENDRLPVNLLLTYSKDKKKIKFLSLPRDTYSPIVDKHDKATSYDKLSHAYVNSLEGAEDVKTTVSKLFDLPIDYYAVIDLESFSNMVDSVNGIEYELQEDIRVRAISQVAFEFVKGKQRLNGEEVVALLMDATVESSLNEEHLLNIISTVINQTISILPESELKQFGSKIAGNIPIEQWLESNKELPSMQFVSLIDGMKNSTIDETFYIQFEEEFLHSVTEELTTFD